MTRDSNILLKRRLFTIQDYHLMADSGIISPDSRVELLNGEIIEMSPINSQHAGTVNELLMILAKSLPENLMVTVQNPVELSLQSEPEPDLAIVKTRADKYRNGHPKPQDILLVIEVSDTTLDKDRTIKLPLYAAAGVPEAWIVNLKELQIEVYTLPTEQGYSNMHIYRKGELVKNEFIDDLPVDKVILA